MHRYVDQRTTLSKVPAGEIRDRLERFLITQPTAPKLIGRNRAAEILGCKSPHIARYEKQGRMPEPIPVEGSSPVYIEEEVVALGDELEKERQERERKRKES